MSGALPLVIALNAVNLSVPSLDGLRGISAGYERWLPTPQISLGASFQLRESAVGDYAGSRVGAGAEVRWYFRQKAWFHAQPTGSMIGWWSGGRIDIALDRTRDLTTDRQLGSTIEVGTSALAGYRFAPWRGLHITPSAGVVWRHDFALGGRIPDWSRGGIAVGLDVGWMF